MPKRICCCNEKPGTTKHYIAIPCYEYNSNNYAEIGIQQVFHGLDTGISYKNPGPTAPFRVIGTTTVNQTNTWKISPDPFREVTYMMKSGGGGARPLSYGGNAAYSDFLGIAYDNSILFNLWFNVPPGGTGPDPGNFDIHTTIPLLGGGPGYPLAGWGGGAAAWGTYGEVLLGGRIITGAGAGAGADLSSVGGHGGIDNGITGSGDYPGQGGSQLAGGAAGDVSSTDGSFTKGGKGYGSWSSIDPTDLGGGGGGAGYYGGGGGGRSSSGGGGSTTKEDIFSNQTIDSAGLIPGTDIGPGNRCSPYFTFNMDPGLGGQRTGRYIDGITFSTGFSGAPGQAAEYHRTKWCPCNETQTNFELDSTGKIVGPLHICLSQEQYNSIIATLPDIDPPALDGVRVSFSIDGERYILVQIDPNTDDPSTDHYYCTLGCEDQFVKEGFPSDVKWYIPSKNFTCFNETFHWFANHLEYNFENITSCCDCFLGKPICTNPYENCLGSYDAFGKPQGCLCGATAPAPAAICKDLLPDQNVAYYSFDEDSKWVYLVVPGICWTFFGNENIVKKFECTADSKTLSYRGLDSGTKLLLNNLGDATTIDPNEIAEKYCNETINAAYCKDTGGTDCEITILEQHRFCDYYGIKCPLTITSAAKLCVHTVYGCLDCPECPYTEFIGVNADPTITFRCYEPKTCEAVSGCDSWYPKTTPCQTLEDCLNNTASPLLPFKQLSTKRILDIITSPFKSSFYQYSIFGGAKKILNRFGLNYYDSTDNQIKLSSMKINSKLLNWTGDNFNSLIGGIDTGGGNGGPDVCPCDPDGQVIATACLNATKVGYKFNIKRMDCPPDDYLSCETCGECDPAVKEENKCIIKSEWFGGIVETSSWESTTCFRLDNLDEQELQAIPAVEDVMSIKFPACMFDGLTEVEDKISKAYDMVGLDEAYVPVVYEGVLIDGGLKKIQVLNVCGLKINLVSSSTTDISQKINQCLGGANGNINASPLNIYVWFSWRLEICQGFGSIPPTPYLKPGDILLIGRAEYFPADQSVKIYFNAKNGDAARACASQVTEPLCMSFNNQTSFCGAGVHNSAYSSSYVTAAGWSSGDRWNMLPYTQTERYADIQYCGQTDNLLINEYIQGIDQPQCFDIAQDIKAYVYGPGNLTCKPDPCIPGQAPCCVLNGVPYPCPAHKDRCLCEGTSTCVYHPQCSAVKQCTTNGGKIIITNG